jgi:hypothetical protein
MTRGATDNDTTAHREHGEPADLPAITNCASSFRTIPERGLGLWPSGDAFATPDGGLGP